MWLQVIIKVKVTHQGEGHIKVKVKYLHPFKFYVAHTPCKRVVCIQLKCYLFWNVVRSMSSGEFTWTNFGRALPLSVQLPSFSGSFQETFTEW